MPPRQVSMPRLIHVAPAAQLTEAEVTARFAAVFFRRVRDKRLYRPSDWSSWRAFCGYFCPVEPERIDILIRALEVLESRGEKRDFDEAEARQLAGWGGNRGNQHTGGKRQVDNIKLARKGGTRATYLAARIIRDHPEIAEAVKRGEYPLIRAAAKAAGIIKPPDAYKQLLAWWDRASDEERISFKVYLTAWRSRDVVPS
jgi:hypothetical protein